MKNIILAAFLYMMSMSVFATKTINLTDDNMLVLNDAVSAESASNLLNKAFKLSLENPHIDLYLVLDSPGGDVVAGMNVIEGLNALPNKVHTITFSAASMAYQMAQNLGTRYITKYGYLMSHRAKLGGIGGQMPGELDTRLNFYKDLLGTIDVDTAKRIGISLPEYTKLIHDEYWVIGDAAVKANHADEVVLVSCSKKLIESRVSKSTNGFLGSYTVKWSGCPAILYPLGIKANDELGVKNMKEFRDSIINKKTWNVKGL